MEMDMNIKKAYIQKEQIPLMKLEIKNILLKLIN